MFSAGEGHDCTKESLECVDCDTICAVCFQLGEGHDHTKESLKCVDCDTICAVFVFSAGGGT